MESLLLTILTILAFIGTACLIHSVYDSFKAKTVDAGYKLVLIVPEKSESRLEGTIRRIFLEKIPDRLLSDGKVYLVIPEENDEALKIAHTLKRSYPLEVLQDPGRLLYDILNKS